MSEEKPKIIGVFKELDLLAHEIHIKFGSENSNGESEYYVVEGDPDVTETMTCTDLVCSTSEAKFPGRMKSFQIRCVLPHNIQLANELKINLKRHV